MSCKYCNGLHYTEQHNCELCTRIGHNYGDCPDNKPALVRCQLCDNPGHIAKNCYRNIQEYTYRGQDSYPQQSRFQSHTPAHVISLSKGYQGIKLVPNEALDIYPTLWGNISLRGYPF